MILGKCEQCGRSLGREDHAELHTIVSGEREVMDFCDYACIAKYLSGQENSENALKEFQSEVLE